MASLEDHPCPQCATLNHPYALSCYKCNALLFDPKTSTVMMRIDPAWLRLRRPPESPAPAALEQVEYRVSLSIRGMVEKITFEEGTELVLGRADLNRGEADRFDLTRYGAHERGVSRAHALLRYARGQLTVTDLNSANGTSVNGAHLAPNEPQIVNDHDEIMLGRLAIRVRFGSTGETGKLRLSEGEATTTDMNAITSPAAAVSRETPLNMPSVLTSGSAPGSLPEMPSTLPKTSKLSGTTPLSSDADIDANADVDTKTLK